MKKSKKKLLNQEIKMKIVLDTNVLISSLINPNGHPAAVLNLILLDEILLLYDLRIINEYRNVLSRKKFSFNSNIYEPLLEYFIDNGIFVIPKPVKTNFADKDDLIFYEVAHSGEADFLITGNIKHYPKEKLIVTPSLFLEKF